MKRICIVAAAALVAAVVFTGCEKQEPTLTEKVGQATKETAKAVDKTVKEGTKTVEKAAADAQKAADKAATDAKKATK